MLRMRWYCPQACDRQRGWTDLPSLASKKEHGALRLLKKWIEFRESKGESVPQTRVWPKPHGWSPPQAESNGSVTAEIPDEEDDDVKPAGDVHYIVYYDTAMDPPEPISTCLRGTWPKDKMSPKWDDVTCPYCLLGRVFGREKDKSPSEQGLDEDKWKRERRRKSRYRYG